MHLCIAGSIRAMPEKEKPPAMPVDIYLAYDLLFIFSMQSVTAVYIRIAVFTNGNNRGIFC